jgi:hypothetical protein
MLVSVLAVGREDLFAGPRGITQPMLPAGPRGITPGALDNGHSARSRNTGPCLTRA